MSARTQIKSTYKWNHRIHRMLLLWLRQIGVNFDAHHTEATRLSNIDGYYLTALSVFAALTAVASLVNVAEFGSELKWLSITLKVIAACASILVIFFNNMRDRHKFAENATRNRNSAEQYDDLSAYIQVATLSDSKPEAGMFLRTIMDRFRFIKQAGPDLPEGFASIASLPNLILMKDAQRRADVAKKKPWIRKKDEPTPDAFITEDDKHLFGGSSTLTDEPAAESEPVRTVKRFLEENPVRSEMLAQDLPHSYDEAIEQMPASMTRYTSEDFADNICESNIEILQDRAVDSDDDDDSIDTSMEIINDMGLCSPETKPSIPDAEHPYRPEPMYIGPKVADQKPKPPGLPKSPRRRHTLFRDTIKSKFNLNEKPPPPTPKQRLDSALGRKMEILKLQNNAY